MRRRAPTGFRCITELLDMTVWSPSMSTSLLSSPASVRLFTELLWELALIDMLGVDWLLPTLLTVPVRLPMWSGSLKEQERRTVTRLQHWHSADEGKDKRGVVGGAAWRTSSSSCTSVNGPLWASWNKIFFILRYCKLSSSRTASFVRFIRSIRTDSGRSRWTKACWGKHTRKTSRVIRILKLRLR